MKPENRRPRPTKPPLHRSVKRRLLLERNSRADRVGVAKIAKDHAERCIRMQRCLRNSETPHRAYALAHLAQSVVMYDRAIDGLRALREDAKANS